MKPWTIIQHVAYEGPALIADELNRAAIPFAMARLDLGQPLPAVADLGGLIVMGGPMGVYDAGQLAFLGDEQALLRQAAAAGLPVLGVCLGSQLLAAAYGATVAPGPVFETGIGEVTLTPSGRGDPVLGPGPVLPVMHWHQDTFDLPADAVLLASSAAYRHQAFRLGARVYGLQFHFELDAALAADWLPRLPEAHRFTEDQRQAVETAGRVLMRRFLEVAR